MNLARPKLRYVHLFLASVDIDIPNFLFSLPYIYLS